MRDGNAAAQRWTVRGRIRALLTLALCLAPSLARGAEGEGFLLYRAVSAADPSAIDLNIVGAPAGALIQIHLYLGVPETEQAPFKILFQGTARPDGSLCIALDRSSLQQAGLAQVSVQAQCFDPEDGSSLRSNLTTLTARPTLHLLLESFDGSPLEPRVVEYDPQVDQLSERVEGLLGTGFERRGGSSSPFDVHVSSGAVFFVPSNAESTLARAGSKANPLAHLGFGNQRVVDVAFTRDQSVLTVLTESSNGAGRSSLSLHAIEVDSRDADRGRLRSSGPLFTAQTGACEAWLVPSDDSQRVFVAIHDESGLDRIQQWVLGEELREGCRVSPIRRYGEQIRAVRSAGEFLATVNVDARGENARLQVFHLSTSARVFELELPGPTSGLELWTDGDSRAEVAVLSRQDGEVLLGASVDLRSEPPATVRPALPVPGARRLASSPDGASLFVGLGSAVPEGSAAAPGQRGQVAVLRVDRARWQVEGSLVRGLDGQIGSFGVVGGGDQQWLYLTTPMSAGSPSEVLYCYQLDPSTGRRLGPARRHELGATATRILAH